MRTFLEELVELERRLEIAEARLAEVYAGLPADDPSEARS